MLAADNLPLTNYPVSRKIERYAGSYSVALSARLVRFSLRHVRSYARQRDGDGKPWGEQPRRRESFLAFRDLMELRVARALHKIGIPWHEVCHFARYDAKKLGNKDHVLSHHRFLTHDRQVFKHDPAELKSLTAPIEYDEQGIPIRWNISQEWNIAAPDAVVVIDPRLSFGSPVLCGCYVPTYILHQALLAEDGDYHTVAEDYEVRVTQVQLAHRFETMLWEDYAISS